MNLKYRAITANCGNSTLGETATNRISNAVSEEKGDFYIINCQEVDHGQTLAELKESLLKEKDYEVVMLNHIHTMTKPSEILAGKTGIATFCIYNKKNLDLEITDKKNARRTDFRMGKGYSKGGVITEVVLKSKEEPSSSISLEAVSAHLDSNKMTLRALDWYNIHKSLAKQSKNITNFNQLAEAMPNIRVSGYDANTRNKLGEDGEFKGNIWENNDYEVNGLKQAALGGTRFSAESTYKSYDPTCLQEKSDKRKGYTKGGMLDFVDVLDGKQSEGNIITDGIEVIPPEEGQGRDHAVIISNLMVYETKSKFENTKNQMSAMLAIAAPKLATELRNMLDNTNNRMRLVEIYQSYLSQEGLLLAELKFFEKKLGFIDATVTPEPAVNKDSRDKFFFESKEEGAWFKDAGINNYASEAANINARQTSEKEQIDKNMGLKLRSNSDLTSIESSATPNIDPIPISSERSSSRPSFKKQEGGRLSSLKASEAANINEELGLKSTSNPTSITSSPPPTIDPTPISLEDSSLPEAPPRGLLTRQQGVRLSGQGKQSQRDSNGIMARFKNKPTTTEDPFDSNVKSGPKT